MLQGIDGVRNIYPCQGPWRVTVQFSPEIERCRNPVLTANGERSSLRCGHGGPRDFGFVFGTPYHTRGPWELRRFRLTANFVGDEYGVPALVSQQTRAGPARARLTEVWAMCAPVRVESQMLEELLDRDPCNPFWLRSAPPMVIWNAASSVWSFSGGRVRYVKAIM